MGTSWRSDNKPMSFVGLKQPLHQGPLGPFHILVAGNDLLVELKCEKRCRFGIKRLRSHVQAHGISGRSCLCVSKGEESVRGRGGQTSHIRAPPSFSSSSPVCLTWHVDPVVPCSGSWDVLHLQKQKQDGPRLGQTQMASRQPSP